MITLSPTDDLIDYRLSLSGDYIYTIQKNLNYLNQIRKYNTTSFTADSFISIQDKKPQNLLIDNNNFIIIDYDRGVSPTTQKQVFLSLY